MDTVTTIPQKISASASSHPSSLLPTDPTYTEISPFPGSSHSGGGARASPAGAHVAGSTASHRMDPGGGGGGGMAGPGSSVGGPDAIFPTPSTLSHPRHTHHPRRKTRALCTRPAPAHDHNVAIHPRAQEFESHRTSLPHPLRARPRFKGTTRSRVEWQRRRRYMETILPMSILISIVANGHSPDKKIIGAWVLEAPILYTYCTGSVWSANSRAWMQGPPSPHGGSGKRERDRIR